MANGRMVGGPGTSDPGRITYTNVILKPILERAYGLKFYQLSGPAWLDEEKFDITAKVPAGATKEQLNTMLRNLLVDRFRLTFHRETREIVAFDLVVGKSGSKLKESDLSLKPEARTPDSTPFFNGQDRDGFPTVQPGTYAEIGRITDGVMLWTYQRVPLPDLVVALEDEFTRPIVDKTGLTGVYDFHLAYSREGLRVMRGNLANPATDPTGAPNLLTAVQQQLGLKLEPAKEPINVMVIDHIERMPTGN